MKLRPELLLDDIYEACVDEKKFEGLARLIGESAGFDSALIMRRNGLMLTEASMMLEASYIEEYQAYYGRIDPFAHATLRAPKGIVTVGEEILRDSEWIETEFYRDFARHQGVFRPMGISFDLAPGEVLSFGVNRDKARAGAFDPDERAWMAFIGDHLRRAMQLRRRLQEAEKGRVLRDGLLDALDLGLFLVDEGLKLVHANSAAETMLRESAGFSLRSGRLACVMAPDTERLRTLVTGVLSGDSGGGLHLSNEGAGTLLLCLVSRVPTHIYAGAKRLVLVSARRAGGRAGWPATVLMSVFRLSPAEAWVCSRIAEGLSPDEIALERNITIATLRTQLRSVFRKTGVGTQRELMKLVGSLPQIKLG